MKSCQFCGRHNEDVAVYCVGCGTPVNAAGAAPGFRSRGMLRWPSGWVRIFAFVAILHGFARLAFTSYDPSLGEGDYKRVGAAFWFWLSLGIGLVLFGYGCYLMKKETNERKGG